MTEPLVLVSDANDDVPESSPRGATTPFPEGARPTHGEVLAVLVAEVIEVVESVASDEDPPPWQRYYNEVIEHFERVMKDEPSFLM